MKVSKELYNFIQNANDLQILKNSIEEDISTDLTYDKKHIIVRILSTQEYDKYIKNETLNGSILNKNINVWHYDDTPGEHGICGGTQSVNLANALNPDPSIKTIINFITQKISNTMNNYYARYNININAELSSQNSNKLCNFTLIRDTLLKCYTWAATNYSSMTPSSLSTTIISCQLDKNLAITAYSAESTRTNYLGEPCFTIITANINLSFRPVFNYVDNNKSKNIYC